MTGRLTTILFLTGLSGSGKSLASRVLEDAGYYVLDNLPANLVTKFLELLQGSGEDVSRAALVVDVRSPHFVRDFPSAIKSVRDSGYETRLLFLEASDEELLHRFKETRRTHPLAVLATTSEAITKERAALLEIRETADLIIDTTSLTSHTLARRIMDWLRQDESASRPFTITLLTFGFKFGVPGDADWVVDVRFLKNPFFVPELRPLSGHDEAIRSFVRQCKSAVPFVRKLTDLLRGLVPLYAAEGRSRLTLGIGCTGGRHRSVAIAAELAGSLSELDVRILSVDRDLERA